MNNDLSAHFYTGIFHSQFLTLESEDLKSWNASDIILEQRFLLRVEREISFEEFENAKSGRFSNRLIEWQFKKNSAYYFEPATLASHVLIMQNHDIELEFNDGSARLEICSECYVEFGVNDLPEELRCHDFTAFKDGRHHGRITGRGYVRIPVLTLEARDQVKREMVQQDVRAGKGHPSPLASTSGCLSRRGCLTSLTVFLPRGNKAPEAISASGYGCLTGSGCGKTGCGLLSLFLLLGLLISFWRSCSQGPTFNPGPRVIHDTIFVDEASKRDVIKQLMDTSTVFKTESIELPNVQFYTNSARLLPYSINSIQQLADYLTSHDGIHAVIEGHTDNIGDPNGNLQLSKQRAESVRNLLISLGVDPDRLEAHGFGKSRPRASNETVEGRALNRRVEVKLINTEYIEVKSTEVIHGD